MKVLVTYLRFFFYDLLSNVKPIEIFETILTISMSYMSPFCENLINRGITLYKVSVKTFFETNYCHSLNLTGAPILSCS